MKKVSYNKSSREHTYIMVLGIAVLVFLMLVSVARHGVICRYSKFLQQQCIQF